MGLKILRPERVVGGQVPPPGTNYPHCNKYITGHLEASFSAVRGFRELLGILFRISFQFEVVTAFSSFRFPELSQLI
jgi:hypothetical protein